ncbi:MAG: transporter substrate-binding domain-containing protein [Oscillospiraceae bacterium]|nr:transporter substrate-binding domain-containing protein [Oscillospiraceae bacterium]
MKKGSILILWLIMIALLPACGTVKQDSILDVVLERGVVYIGSGNSTPPMNYMDEDMNWIGFDLDLSAAIADRLGVKLERVVVNNTTRISFLANGTVDMVVSNMSHTRSRDEQIDFVEPAYLWTGKIAYAKKGRFTSLTDLAGKRIAVDQGSNAYIAIQQEIEKVNGEEPDIQSFQSNSECFLALKQDKVDAYTQDSVIIAGVAGREGVEYEAIGGVYSPGLYSIGVPPNDSKWRDEIGFILQDLMRDGTYDEIYDKWFGPDGKFPVQPSAKPVLPKEVFGDNQLFVWPD